MATHAPPPSLPASLDKLYPPQANEPVFLHAMLRMTTPLEGVMIDLQEHDIDGAKANFEQFSAALTKVASLVPEWQAHFPTDQLGAVGKALASGDQRRVMAAFGGLAKTCEGCHVTNMVRVQQKFHWPAFHTIEVNDPLTKQTVPFERFKQSMSGALSGIGNDLAQGQKANAIEQFSAFRTRFEAFKKVCRTCHESAPRYYVDDDVDGLVEALGKAVTAAKPDAEAITRLRMQIGDQSCAKCHRVHVPAAFAKHAGGLPPAPLPFSLDAQYKPGQPDYLMTMHAMTMPFEGIMVDLQEKDIEGATANFKAFSAALARTAKLVPEWEKHFPTGQLDAAGQALASGDQAKVMAAFGGLSKSCESCHVANMARVQMKYQWSKFSSTFVTDPLTKQSLPFKQFKVMLSGALSGIGIDLEQGQRDNAVKQFEAFKARFGALKQSCSRCHGDERRVYVDKDADQLIADLGSAIQADKPDPKKIMGIAMKLGQETCFKCHLVHVPAALSQDQADAAKWR